MSCFPGHMNEYLEISLDRFDGENLQSTAYFLSHKHEDHMVGLSSASFRYRLETNCHIKFYCSEVTRDLLKLDPRFRWLEQFTVALKVDVPYILKVPDKVSCKEKYTVTVTPLHAGHCPGSVMFLFEGNEGTALYTGDIRLNRSDLQGFQSLHLLESPKHINSLYLDTTFCVPEALFIPTRDESAEAALQLIKQWLALSRNHFIRLKCSAGLGYEHLFIRIAQELNTKVHVSEQKHKEYTNVEAFPSFSTPDPSATRIHCCAWNKDRPAESRLPCGYIMPEEGSEMEVRTITLSTMWFTQRADLDSAYCARKAPYSYRVCYSFHSSYSELRDMIIYLRPAAIRPNVLPYKEKDFSAVQGRLNRFQKLACQSVPVSSDSQPRKLGVQRKRKRKVLPSASSGSEGMDWGDLSPLKKAKLSQGSAEFTVNYNQLDSSQGSNKSAVSEKEEMHFSSEEEDDDSELDILDGLEDDEDVKLAKESFKPVNSGSYGEFVSYVSDISDEENDDKIDAKPDVRENKLDSQTVETGKLAELDNVSSPKPEHMLKIIENKGSSKIENITCNGGTVLKESEDLLTAKTDGVLCVTKKSVIVASVVNSVDSEHVMDMKEVSKDAPEVTSEADANSEMPVNKNGELPDSVGENIDNHSDKVADVKNNECKEKPASMSLECNESHSDSKETNAKCDGENVSESNKKRVPVENAVGDDAKKSSSPKPKHLPENDDNCSSDVEEVGHVIGEHGDDGLDDQDGQVIDLTEEDELSDMAESESLFSSHDGDSVLSDDADAQYGDKYILNSDGELCMEERDSDVTVDDDGSNAGYSDNEIVISSDEESSPTPKEQPIKQTARKSAAKKSASVSTNASDVDGCANGDDKSEDGNVIILEDSLDGEARSRNCAEPSVSSKEDTNNVSSDEPDKQRQDNGDTDETVAEKVLLTSVALNEKLNTAKEMSKKSEVQESESENVECENESVETNAHSEEL